MKSAEQIIELQLKYYNQRDLDSFRSLFSDNIEAFELPDIEKPVFSGKEELSERYQERFDNSPNLHSKVKNRLTIGNFVLDDEQIQSYEGGKEVRSIVIYEVQEESITRMWFINGEDKPSKIIPVENQLLGYNSRDIDIFLDAYTTDCQIFDLALGELRMKNKDEMRKRYTDLFESSPQLNAIVENRLYLDDFVIDQESVTGFQGDQEVHAIAIYQVLNEKISKVWFLK